MSEEPTYAVIAARVSPDEKERIKAAAQAEGETVSRFLRLLARRRADAVLNGRDGSVAAGGKTTR